MRWDEMCSLLTHFLIHRDLIYFYIYLILYKIYWKTNDRVFLYLFNMKKKMREGMGEKKGKLFSR